MLVVVPFLLANARDAGAAFGVLVLIAGVAVLVKLVSEGGGGCSHSARPFASRGDRQAPAIERPCLASVVREINFGSFPVAAWLRRHGWVHDGNGVYRGQFVARSQRLRGEVHYRAGEFESLVHSPPSWATQGSHSACWRERPGGWQLLHLNASPANVVEAIVGCQAFLQRKLEENAT